MGNYQSEDGAEDAATHSCDGESMCSMLWEGKSGTGNLIPQRTWPVVIWERQQCHFRFTGTEVNATCIDHTSGREQQKLWSFQSYLHTQ